MKDQFAPFASYVPPGTWPYWMLNPLIGGTTPAGDWPQSSPASAPNSSGGLFGNLAQPVGGILGNFAAPVENTGVIPMTAINGRPIGWAPTTTPPVFLSTLLQNDRSQPLSGASFPYPAVPAYLSDQFDPLDSDRGVATPSTPEQPLPRPRVMRSSAYT